MKALDAAYTCISHGHVATYVNVSHGHVATYVNVNQGRAQSTCTRCHCSMSSYDDVKTISQRKRSLPLP